VGEGDAGNVRDTYSADEIWNVCNFSLHRFKFYMFITVIVARIAHQPYLCVLGQMRVTFLSKLCWFHRWKPYYNQISFSITYLRTSIL